MIDQENMQLRENVIDFPTSHLNFTDPKSKKEIAPTPLVDAMDVEYRKLDELSMYKSSYDWEPMRSLERRSLKNPIRGGITFKSPFKLVNAHSTCQQCLYAFEVDTYGRGCVHNCHYCYAKEQLTSHGYWNNPHPVPIDLSEVRKVFYTTFETDKPNKWRSVLAKRIPIRIGSMSDSFMWMDDKYKVTKEFIKILNFYRYPHLIFTRSDLVAKDDYLAVLDKKLCSVQFSISSINEPLNKQIEPGAPSVKRRLNALKKINNAEIWTTVRLNPMFPIHPDGFFTDNNFSWEGPVPKFDFSSFDIVDAVADVGVRSLLAGFVRLSPYALNRIEEATGVNLRPFFRSGNTKSTKDFHYSDREIRYYYQTLKAKCQERNVEFTTCYIGNGENHFWKDQDLWANSKDCCNVKGHVSAFNADSREIPFSERLKVSNAKSATPNDAANLHKALGEQRTPLVVPQLVSSENDLPL